MTERRHDARHPFEIAPIALLVAVSIAQLVLGPKGSTVVLSMPEWSQRTFAATLLAGCLLTLGSMLKTGPVGRWMELAGLFMCALTLAVYSATAVAITPAWLTNPAVAFSGVAAACAFRMGQILRNRR